MKPRGQYLLGIDFEHGDTEPKMVAIPMRRGSPLWHQAEVISKDGFENIIDEVRRKVREKEKPAGG